MTWYLTVGLKKGAEQMAALDTDSETEAKAALEESKQTLSSGHEAGDAFVTIAQGKIVVPPDDVAALKIHEAYP
jgi:hypothetical protein